MDDISLRLQSLERKSWALLVMVVVLALAIAAQLLGWVPSIRTSEARTEKIVLSEGDGGYRSIEISARGLRLADARRGTEMWLIPPSNEEPCIQVTSPTGTVMIGPASLELASKEGGLIQAQVAGARPIIMILSGKNGDGSVDIGAGFATVKGSGGSVVIDGRGGSRGLRVIDEKGDLVSPR